MFYELHKIHSLLIAFPLVLPSLLPPDLEPADRHVSQSDLHECVC